MTAQLTRDEIEDMRDYLMDLECPFNYEQVNALCDLALFALAANPPAERDKVRRASAAANAYPKLVSVLRQAAKSQLHEITASHTAIVALLRELGEL